MAELDLKIVDSVVRDSYEGIDRICLEFKDNARIAQDISAALGHSDLAAKMRSFSESWRVNREHMVKTFESLSTELREKLRIFDDLDKKMAGDDRHGGQEGDTGSSGTGQTQPPAPSSQSGPSPMPGPAFQPHNGGGTAPSGSLPTSVGGGSPGGGVSTPGGSESSLPVEAKPFPIDDLASFPEGRQAGVGIDDPGLHVSVAVGAGGAVSAIGAVASLFWIWEKSRESRGSGGSGGVEEPTNVRSQLMAELNRLRGRELERIELTTDPKNPDEVLAILRGEDGTTTTVHLGEQVGVPEPGQAPTSPETGQSTGPDPMMNPNVGVPTSGAEEPTSGGSRLPTASEEPLPDPLNSPGVSSSHSSGIGGGSTPSLGPHLPDPFGGRASPHLGHVATTPLHTPDAPRPDITPVKDPAHLPGQGQAAAAGTMGVGLMGMGMAGAASSPAASPRERDGQPRRLPLPSEDQDKAGEKAR